MTNEAFSRVKIDAQLRDQGWEITNTNAVRFESVLPDRTKADYVLCDRNGRSLAVVEAKKAATNPAEAEAQAKAYAAQVYPAVLHFGQTIAKITNMALYHREVIANPFYEMLHDKVFDNLAVFHSQENAAPMPAREELVVDYVLETLKATIYLFSVKERESPKLRLAAVSCLEFQKLKLPFRRAVDHQDIALLSKADQRIITNAADKQFTSLDEFDAAGRDAIERLAA